MAMCVDALRARQIGAPGHEGNQLTGPDPDHPGHTLTQSVEAWFQGATRTFMTVLSDPANGWIVKGSSANSRFVTELLGTQNPMSRAFEGSGGPATGNKTWKQVAVDWIDKGCLLPAAPPPAVAHVAIAKTPAHVGRTIRRRLTLTSSVSEVRNHPRGRVLGMGVVH
jgi:hypothetical protein